MKKYDLIISLGGRCRMASALKKLKITEKTYPFDWTAYNGDVASMYLLTKCNLIKSHFENAFNFEDFVEYDNPGNPSNRSVKNNKTILRFGHDFPWEKSVEEFFPEFLEKYQRRIKRLYDDIEKANNILFVFEDPSMRLPLEAIKKGIATLKECFPNKDITLLVFLPLLPDGTKQSQELKLNIDNVIVLLCSRLDGEGITYNEEVCNMARYLEQFFGNDYYSFAENKDIICSGLSGVESFGRWSDGDMVFFELPTTLKEPMLYVDINVTPFVCPARPNQKCKIICNGHEIKEVVVDKPQTINLTVPNDNNGNLDFVFEFDNTQSPNDLGVTSDTRRLGFGFIDALIKSNQ